MSDIRCKCDACDATFVVMDDFAGKKVRCPKCGNINLAGGVSRAVPDKASESCDSAPFLLIAQSAKENDSPSVDDNPASFLDVLSSDSSHQDFAALDFSAAGGTRNAGTGKLAHQSKGTFGESQVSSLTQRSKQTEGSPLMVFVAGGGAILLLLLFVVAIVGTLPEEKQRQAEKLAKQKQLTLFVLNWKEDVDAQLLIDGERKELPEELTQQDYPITPGSHQVVLQRRGYQPIHLDLELERGESFEFTPEWKPAAVDTIAALVPVAENLPTSHATHAGDGAALLSNPALRWSPPQLSGVDLTTRAGKMEAAFFKHLLIHRQIVEITTTIRDNNSLDAAAVLIPPMEKELAELVAQGNELGPIQDQNQLLELKQKYVPYVNETRMMIPYAVLPNPQLATKWQQKLQPLAQLLNSYRGPSFFQADDPQISSAAR